MSGLALAGPGRALPRPMVRLGIALGALAAVALLLWGVALLFGPGAAPAAPPRNPFGTGLREAAPDPGGIGGAILAMQSRFYRALTGAVAALRGNEAALPGLLGIGFAYGAFHAAGPGHGKAVVAGYLLASRRTLRRGLVLSLGAAFLQALVAIAIVAVMRFLLGATAARVSAAANAIEIGSFALLAGFGLLLLWRKTARLLPDAHVHGPGEDCAACGHAHVPSAARVERVSGIRDGLGVVIAAGSRPCSGAIVLLVFAAAQGVFAAGIAAAFAMALGTALTTGALAALAVGAKGLALRVAGRGGAGAGLALAAGEVLAAAFVAALGLALLVGLWSGGG